VATAADAYRSDLAKAAVAELRKTGLNVSRRAERGGPVMSILIKGGRVITAADDYVGDVFVDDGRVSLIGESLDVQADRVVDASGKYLLPGLVDPHTHLDMPFGGTVTCDDFESGHVSAAFGGTTTHVDFCIQPHGTSFGDALAQWHAKREGKAIIDNGFHIAVTDLREGGTLEELASLPEQGVTSYKLFMAYKGALQVDDETLFRTMQVAAETGALVMVHAENGDAIDVLVKEALAAGHTEPVWHARTRPPETEGEATNRAIQLARVAGAALYVVHVSCREAAEPIALARERGWRVWGETCTQYLYVDETFLERPDFEGAKFVYTPPPRAKENQDVLWRAVATDVLSAISTDHCAFRWDGQKTIGRDDFSKIPNGGPGIENRLHVVHELGVRAGRISLNRMVELLATNPAKLFGLYPRKGTIAVGSDADIVVFDPEKQLTLSAASHHSRCDYNLFEGLEVTGAPELVLRRGEVIVDGDRLVAEPGSGQFIRRARVGEELAPTKLAELA
jgi:dihydropyrimidinase